MGPKTKELIAVLDELEVLLKEHEESLWENWMIESKKKLLASDLSGVNKLLGAYGGMGSFNDLIIGYYQKEGITQQRKGHGVANQKLEALRSRANDLATEIKNELNKNIT